LQEKLTHRHYSIFHYSLPTSYYHSNHLFGNFSGHILLYNILQNELSLQILKLCNSLEQLS